MNDIALDQTQHATGLLALAQKRLLRDFPFHAGFLASWKQQPCAAVPTMGVTVCGSTIQLLFNPTFVISCSLDELMGVLHHEIHHLLMGHVFMSPDDVADPDALTIAQEVTANEWVREPLPGRPWLLADFPQLPPDEDTLTRYRRLARDRLSPSSDQILGNDVPNAPVFGPKSVETGPISEAPCTLDDHGVWATARASGVLGQMVVRVAIHTAAAALSPDEWAQLSEVLRHALKGLEPGSAAGDVRQTLSRTQIRAVDWRVLLRRFVRAATARRAVFNLPPRRFPQLIGLVPGKVCRPDRAVVMAVVDTSASMSTALLEEIAAQLVHLSHAQTVTVVECDARVQRVYPFAGSLRVVHGRGGTDFRPVFTTDLLRQVRPDVTLIFTDGEGPAPEQPPAVPVLWCLTGDGEKPVSWGRELRLPLSHA